MPTPPVSQMWLGAYGSKAKKRALFIACANFRWCLAQALVLLRDPILPRLEIY